MSAIAQRYARDLARRFYAWELRGRGWIAYPNPVSVEPPFREFEGHILQPTRVVDDGRIETIGSKFAKGLAGMFGGATSAPPRVEEEELEEPYPDAISGDPDIVELQIALPPDFEAKGVVFEQFLQSLDFAGGSIAYEILGTAVEIVVSLAVRMDAAPSVRDQVKAFFPEAVIEEVENGLIDTLEGTGGEVRISEYGLEREFMVPLGTLKNVAADPLVSMCGSLQGLKHGEAALFQVLLQPTNHPWAISMLRAVTWNDGKPFFADDAELVAQTREKGRRPLYSAALRILGCADSQSRAGEIVEGMAASLRPLSTVSGNGIVSLPDSETSLERKLQDIVFRRTRRPGMIVNSEELVGLVHLPSAAVRASRLRRVVRKTKAAPDYLVEGDGGVCLGTNTHEGVTREVWLSDALRLNHCHILGGTGSGKSTLLGKIAYGDIISGRGVAVIDPHGDLVDLLLPHIPKERQKDVILFDPTDDEYAIAWNPLGGANDRERDILATDFIAVMKQNTSSWGDQMSSLLGNAVLAFLYSTRGGTLPELRRFLSDKEFRKEFLTTVNHPEVAYFWEDEAPLANKSAMGSILTRLDSLLRYESLLHILGQRKNTLNFAEIMDTGKIFLARLGKGLIGEENAHLLGSLLVSRFYETAIARQARSREDRNPYFLILDEAGDLLTSTVSEILKGTRKYGLSLTLAHQSLAQLRHDDEVYGAVMGSTGTKVCFQVGGDDARKMAEEFGGFAQPDLMNLKSRSAIARVGQRDHSFTLDVPFLPEAPRPLAEAYSEVLTATRSRYCTDRSTIREELAKLRGAIPRERTDPFAKLQKKPGKDEQEAPADAPVAPTSVEVPALSDPLPRSEAIKGEVIRVAGAWGGPASTKRTEKTGF